MKKIIPVKKSQFIFTHRAAIFFTIGYFIIINLVTLHRFWQFETFYFNHGIYDQALWSAAHFRPPLIDHLDDQPIHQLADHFSPSLYLLSPLYWFTSSYEAVIILQNIFFAASAFILYIVAFNRLKNRLVSIALLVAYTLFIGLQNSLISFFHADFIALLSLALSLYFLDKRKWIWFWVFLIITMGAKESFAAIGIGLGIYLLFNKIYRQGLTVIIFSFFYYLFAVKVAIPFFGNNSYLYSSTHYDLPTAIQQFFYPYLKSKTLLISFATFGFLPLAGLSFLPAILQDYIIRFVFINTDARWDLGMHYNAVVSVLLVYGSIVGISVLKKINIYNKLLLPIHAILIIFIAFILHYKLHGPLGLSYNPDFYRHTEDLDFLRNFVKNIPNQGLVLAPNNIAPHLTHTHQVMLLRFRYKPLDPDVIAIDKREGQNPNNFWPLPPHELDQLVSTLTKDPGYTLHKITDDQIIFIKKNK